MKTIEQERKLLQDILQASGKEWKWAAVDQSALAYIYQKEPEQDPVGWYEPDHECLLFMELPLLATDWQNSLIERTEETMEPNPIDERLTKLEAQVAELIAQKPAEPNKPWWEGTRCIVWDERKPSLEIMHVRRVKTKDVANLPFLDWVGGHWVHAASIEGRHQYRVNTPYEQWKDHSDEE